MKVVRRAGILVVPAAVSLALVLTACGASGGWRSVTQPGAPAASGSAGSPIAVPPVAGSPKGSAATGTKSSHSAATEAAPAPNAASAPAGPATGGDHTQKAKGKAPGESKSSKLDPASAVAALGVHSIDVTAAQRASSVKVADDKDGATDTGVTKNSITLGTVNMHDVALGGVLTTPIVDGVRAALSAINDRGGVLGRRMSLIDCNDGVGDVDQSKACIKKLVSQDHIFSFLTYSTWASASIHDDLKQYHIPAVGMWAYSQTEWQDPFMFPTHMSMLHEAMAGAHWVSSVIKPKTYGLLCLNSPEMQLACNQVTKILDASGSHLVNRSDVSISETSMAPYVLAMRVANPDHIVHYVVNPATVAKFMVEAAQQGYYPPLGMSGNNLATETLGSLFGKWPAGRYWTNTSYRLWGSGFMSTMNKYAQDNRGINHHIAQAGYVGANVFALAALAVGPNLTRDRLMAQLNNGDVYSADIDMDQRFSWAPSERNGSSWNHDYGQGREFMYKYTDANTVANPDGSPNGFQPDPNQFVIYTGK
jgi:ABC-type branched-subunit amino acid transport system substrate-binding protein